MAQSDIILRQNEPEELTIPQVDGNFSELDNRTSVPVQHEDYDTLDKVGAKVRELEINGTTGTPGWENIYFGAGAYSATQGDTTSAAEWAAHVNSVGFTVTQGKLMVLHITVKRQVNGQSVMMREMYTFNKNNIPGTWGTGSDNGNITYSDFIFRNAKQISLVEFPAQIIDLGDIGSTSVHDHINNLDPTGIDWEALVVGTDYFFECIIDGNGQIYKYIGELPETVGSGNAVLGAVDFDLAYTDINAEGVAFITSLQQAIEQNPQATSVPEFLNGISLGSAGVGLIQVIDGFNTLFGAAGGTFIINAINGLGFSGENITMNTDPLVSLSRIFWNPSQNNFVDGDRGLTGQQWISSGSATVDFGSGPIPFGPTDILGYHEGKYVKLVDNNQLGGGSSKVLPAVKTTNQTKTNDDVLALDQELQFQLEANSYYMINARIRYAAQGAPDFKFQLEAPAGATGRWYSDADNLNGSSNDLLHIQVMNGFGSSVMNTPFQIYIKTTNAGTFGFKWAQNTLSASGTTVYETSNLIAIKLN